MRSALALAALMTVVVAAHAAPPVDTIRWVAQDVPPHFSFV